MDMSRVIPEDQHWAARTQMLIDRQLIERSTILFGRAIDGRDADTPLFDECLTDDVEFSYPFGKWKGLTEHRRVYRTHVLKLFAATQHFFSNALIDISGNSAVAQYYVTAVHKLPVARGGEVAKLGLIYDQELLKASGHWKIKRQVGQFIWADSTFESITLEAIS